MKEQVRKTLRDKAGFTLVELIVVIAILGILAGVGTVGYSGYIKKANQAADEQLRGYVNSAFAAACLENGVDVQDVNSVSLNLTGADGAKKVSSVSLYDGEFKKYYAGNENSEFKVFTKLLFDAEKHAFVDPVTAGEVSMAYGGGVVKISSEDAAKLADSTFITATDLGVDGLLNKVNDVTKFAAVLNSSMLDSVFASEKFANYMMTAMGIEPTGDIRLDYANMDIRCDELVRKMMEAYPTVYPNTDEGYDAAQNQLRANIAVMFSASNAVGMSQQEISSLLTSDKVTETIVNNVGIDTGTAMSQAALAYGMYTAYAYSTNPDKIAATNDPINIVNSMGGDTDFKDYINSEQGQKDLQGYLGALNMINNSTGDSLAVSHLLINGFNDDQLKALLGQAVS